MKLLYCKRCRETGYAPCEVKRYVSHKFQLKKLQFITTTNTKPDYL